MSENRLPSPGRRRLLAGTGLAAIAAACRAEPDPMGWLQDSDRIRNPPGSFSVRLQLTEFRQRQPVATSTLVVYARPAEDGGEYRNLVRFVAPARDHGKLMLRNGQDLWFYDPASRASVRLSPQQRLLGQASNGDVMTTQLARDYDARWAGDERIRDGDGHEVAAHRLELAARRPEVAYPGVDCWLAADDHRPLMARYRSAEGRLLKSAWFRRWQLVLGEVRPTETVIVDGLDPGWVTVMQLSEHRLREVPAAWLQRDYLARWKDER